MLLPRHLGGAGLAQLNRWSPRLHPSHPSAPRPLPASTSQRTRPGPVLPAAASLGELHVGETQSPRTRGAGRGALPPACAALGMSFPGGSGGPFLWVPCPQLLGADRGSKLRPGNRPLRRHQHPARGDAPRCLCVRVPVCAGCCPPPLLTRAPRGAHRPRLPTSRSNPFCGQQSPAQGARGGCVSLCLTQARGAQRPPC